MHKIEFFLHHFRPITNVFTEVCKSLVIDTADWAESYCIDYVCNKYRQASIESFGYGKGYTYLQEEFGDFLKLLNKLIEVGINPVIIAHGKPRKFELPDEQGAFDRYETKLTRQVAPLIKEWCDMLLFCNYKNQVFQTGESAGNTFPSMARWLGRVCWSLTASYCQNGRSFMTPGSVICS